MPGAGLRVHHASRSAIRRPERAEDPEQAPRHVGQQGREVGAAISGFLRSASGSEAHPRLR